MANRCRGELRWDEILTRLVLAVTIASGWSSGHLEGLSEGRCLYGLVVSKGINRWYRKMYNSSIAPDFKAPATGDLGIVWAHCLLDWAVLPNPYGRS